MKTINGDQERLGRLAASAYMACMNRKGAVTLMKSNWEGLDDWFAGTLWEAIDSYVDRCEVADQLKFEGLQKEKPADLDRSAGSS